MVRAGDPYNVSERERFVAVLLTVALSRCLPNTRGDEVGILSVSPLGRCFLYPTNRSIVKGLLPCIYCTWSICILLCGVVAQGDAVQSAMRCSAVHGVGQPSIVQGSENCTNLQTSKSSFNPHEVSKQT